MPFLSHFELISMWLPFLSILNPFLFCPTDRPFHSSTWIAELTHIGLSIKNLCKAHTVLSMYHAMALTVVEYKCNWPVHNL